MTNIVSALEAEEEKTLIVPPNDQYDRHAIFHAGNALRMKAKRA